MVREKAITCTFRYLVCSVCECGDNILISSKVYWASRVCYTLCQMLVIQRGRSKQSKTKMKTNKKNNFLTYPRFKANLAFESGKSALPEYSTRVWHAPISPYPSPLYLEADQGSPSPSLTSPNLPVLSPTRTILWWMGQLGRLVDCGFWLSRESCRQVTWAGRKPSEWKAERHTGGVRGCRQARNLGARRAGVLVWRWWIWGLGSRLWDDGETELKFRRWGGTGDTRSLRALGKRRQNIQDPLVFQPFVCFLTLHSRLFPFF